MPLANEITEVLSTILPEGARVVTATEALAQEGLLPDEAQFTGSMVPKRLKEFTRGRCAARAALRDLGHEAGPILVGPSREPVWPEGIVGSISHCDEIYAAAVADSASTRSLGIDIEEATPLDDDVLHLVCTPEEIAWLSGPDAAEVSWAGKAIFSAKESLFKCWFPVEGTYLDFLEATLAIDLRGRRWTGRILREPQRGFPVTISGQFRTMGPYLLTACHLRGSGG